MLQLSQTDAGLLTADFVDQISVTESDGGSGFELAGTGNTANCALQ